MTNLRATFLFLQQLSIANHSDHVFITSTLSPEGAQNQDPRASTGAALQLILAFSGSSFGKYQHIHLDMGRILNIT